VHHPSSQSVKDLFLPSSILSNFQAEVEPPGRRCVRNLNRNSSPPGKKCISWSELPPAIIDALRQRNLEWWPTSSPRWSWKRRASPSRRGAGAERAWRRPSSGGCPQSTDGRTSKPWRLRTSTSCPIGTPKATSPTSACGRGMAPPGPRPIFGPRVWCLTNSL